MRRTAGSSIKAASSHDRAPLLVLAVGTGLIAGLTALVAVDVTAVALDETLHKQSAVHYTEGLPGSLFNDLSARGTARLYSLLVSPLFAALDGDVAVRAARALGAVLFAATAWPVYLIAREVIRSRWLCVVAALASIAVPWLTLATTMFTESLALFLFAWAILAMLRALRRPSWWRDALVIVTIVALLCTRVQFGALLPAWLLAVIVWEARAQRSRGLGVWDAGWMLTSAVRRHPVTLIGALVAAAVLLGLQAEGSLYRRIQEVFGHYSEIQDRRALPSNLGSAFLFEAVALSIGVGIVPAILALAWARGALAGRFGRAQLDYCLVAAIVLGVLFAATLYAQGSYLGTASEERYYVYAVPLIWVSAVAALEGGRLERRWIAAAGGALVLLLATIDLVVTHGAQGSFLAPASVTAAYFAERAMSWLEGTTGYEPVVTQRDLLMYLGIIIAAVSTAAIGVRRRRGLLLCTGAVAQVALTVCAFQMTRGELDGIPGRTAPLGFAQLGWVDRGTPGRARVAWLDASVRTGQIAERDRDTLFWNDEIDRVVRVPEQMLPPVNPPLDVLPAVALPGRAHRSLPPPPTGWIVSQRDSPFVQVSGDPVATRPDQGLQLQRVGAAGRVLWLADTLAADGIISTESPAAFTSRPGLTVTLVLVGPGGGPTAVALRIADERRTVRLGTGVRSKELTFSTCSSGAAVAVRLGAVRTTEMEDGRHAAARLGAVKLAAGTASESCP